MLTGWHVYYQYRQNWRKLRKNISGFPLCVLFLDGLTPQNLHLDTPLNAFHIEFFSWLHSTNILYHTVTYLANICNYRRGYCEIPHSLSRYKYAQNLFPWNTVSTTQSRQSAKRFSSRWNLDSPTPLAAGECAPPPFGTGEGTLACG
jgi:hypothetical protein